MTDIAELIADLADEQAALDAMVAELDERTWDRATPAEGWSVRDQIGHLAYFDGAARRAASDPEAFGAEVVRMIETGADPMAEHLARGRSMTPAELLEWWRSERAALAEALAVLPEGVRVPWYGPPMSAASFTTARLMETWAHGTDVADALGLAPVATDRLRHVAFIGWRARPFSYAAHQRSLPEGDVTVVLDGPSGERWSFGEPDGPDVVSGPALDFCLVVTQRRHRDDTALVVSGPLAQDWIPIAQAFAGPPGPGRAPTGGR